MNSREFAYWLISPAAIQLFVKKRFDIADSMDDYPPLSDEQKDMGK